MIDGFAEQTQRAGILENKGGSSQFGRNIHVESC